MKKKLRFLMLTFSILATTFSVTSIFAYNFTNTGSVANIVYRDYIPYGGSYTTRMTFTSYANRYTNTGAVSATSVEEAYGFSYKPGTSAEASLIHSALRQHAHDVWER